MSQPKKHVRSRKGTVKTKTQGPAFLLVLVMMLAFLGVGAVALPLKASAHTPSVSATCDAASVNLVNYQLNPAVPADLTPNNVVVTIDGVVVEDTDFGGSFVKSYPFSNSAVAHTWSVSVVAWDDPSGSNGWTKTYTGTTTPCQPDYFLESSYIEDCGSVEITLRNVSPWIYPMSVEIDGVHSYGPVVDNRGAAPDDQTATRTITFPEDSGLHTVRYRVQAGTESDLYVGLPVGEWTTLTIETNCEPNDVTPVAPTFTPPTCFAVGTIVGIDTDLYIWIRTGPDSEAWLQAVAITAGNNLTGQTAFGPYDLRQLTGDACSPPLTPVTPAPPEWIDECGPDNGYWEYTDTAEYAYTETVNPNGSVTVTVAPKAGVVFPEGTITSWTEEDSNVPCPDERDVITPVTPTVTPQVMVCTADYQVVTTSGTVTIPVTTGGRYLLDGKVVSGTINLAPGTYTFTFEVVSNEYVRSDTVVDLTVVIKAGVSPSCVKPPTTGPKVVTDYVSDTNGSSPLAGLVLVLLGVGVLLGLKRSPFPTKARQR